MPGRRALAGAVAALSLLTACTSSGPAPAPSTAVTSGRSIAPSTAGAPSTAAGASTSPAARIGAPAHFTDCRRFLRLGALHFPSGRLAHLRFTCARIAVPLDHSAPGGPRITLQLIRIHDSTRRGRLPQLVVNPGGPGVSGVELAVNLSARVSDRLLSGVDLVGFDPRGVGSSTPLHCLSDPRKDSINAASPNMLSTAGFAASKRIARSVAQACSRKYGAALAQYNTEQTARDLDVIRRSVGERRLSYLGYSYGTELGAEYVHLFPSRVRVAVLDGAVDPVLDPLTAVTNQLQAFESAFDQFAAWCAGQSPCSSLGDARQAVYRIAHIAARAPIRSSARGETRRATSALFYTGVLYALYSRSFWPTLGDALMAARRGDAGGILALADGYNERRGGRYTNVAEATTAIGCNDSPAGPTDARIREVTQDWASRFRIFGLYFAPSLFSCQQWQPRRTPLPRPTARTAPTVLVVGNLHDPATPYQGAKDLTRIMGHADLLTWDGAGHTSYLEGSSCVDRYVESYLLHRTLPPRGTTCR